MHSSWLRLRVLHIFLDLVLLYASFVLAYFLRVGFLLSSDFPFPTFALLSLGAVFSWIGFLLFAKYYRIPPRHGERGIFDSFLILAGGIIAIGILIVTYFFPRDMIFSRLLGIYAFLFGTVLLFATQWIFKRIMARRKQNNQGVHRTLIVGANRVSERIIQAIHQNPYTPYKIVGVIDPYGLMKKVKGSQILGKLNMLESVCAKQNITALIQCDAFEHTLNLIALCEEKNIQFQFEPALRGISEENLHIKEVAGIRMISFLAPNTAHPLSHWLRRQMFDID